MSETWKIVVIKIVKVINVDVGETANILLQGTSDSIYVCLMSRAVSKTKEF